MRPLDFLGGVLAKKNSKLLTLWSEFFETEKASGLVLMACTVVSIALANSPLGGRYLGLWQAEVMHHSVQHWINDGLMAVFFLLIGLEIERELYIGELSDIKNAALPIAAAVGGMAIPALFHFALNHGGATARGAGIPMATDIAFALGVLALLGSRVPLSLKIFLTALAIIDDLGAIAIIALFYVGDFSLPYFLAAMGVFALLLLCNRLGVDRLTAYLLPGALMWYLMLQSGVHATIAGVLLAFAIPFRDGGEDTPSFKLQHFLHKPIAFTIMPLFALANTGIAFAPNWVEGLGSTNSLGILIGLLAGKPIGIAFFSYLAVKTGVAKLPDSVLWRHIAGAGCLGGIGFTMSIFITLLAFSDAETIEASKLSILIASMSAGTIGYLVLRRVGAPGPSAAAP